MNESEIFLAATQIEDPKVREFFLNSVCGYDRELRARVDGLLKQFAAWEGNVDRFAAELPERLAEIRKQESAIRAKEPLSREPGFQAGARFQHYRVEKCLGVGGMGEVYLAIDEKLNRKVALKVLPLDRLHDETWVRRFHSEARAISALNHPNILTIYEIGNDDDFCYMVTEYIDGTSLRQVLCEQKLDIESAVRIAMDIATGLAVAHKAGIVHRDLKPENIMIRSDGLVKVLDFGLAKQTTHTDSDTSPDQEISWQSTDPDVLMGTVRYMSPEQVRRQTVDYRSDIFSFGVILYEMLLEQLPFTGSNNADVLAMILRNEPRDINRIHPVELKRLIEVMLRKDREQRLLTAREVMVELKIMHDAIRSANATHASETTNQTAIDSEVPEVFYARSGDINIAYQVLGQGDIDIVFVMGWVSHLEWFWKEPSFASFCGDWLHSRD